VIDAGLLTDGLVTAEPILAWRAWTLSGRRDGSRLRLRPIVGSRRPWPPFHPARAVCARPRGHHAPDPACTCGLHATRTPDLLRRTRDPAVVGTVALWGRVIEHEHGYRAEFAYPQRLRLVCYLCFWQRHLAWSESDVVVRLFGGRMVPLCRPHLETSHRYGFPTPLVLPAHHVQRGLLATYAVDLLGT